MSKFTKGKNEKPRWGCYAKNYSWTYIWFIENIEWKPKLLDM